MGSRVQDSLIHLIRETSNSVYMSYLVFISSAHFSDYKVPINHDGLFDLINTDSVIINSLPLNYGNFSYCHFIHTFIIYRERFLIL